jgi:hypothetical protein
MQQKQQLLLLGLLAVLTASASVHGQSTVGLQLVGFSQPDAAIGAADKVRAQHTDQLLYYYNACSSRASIQCTYHGQGRWLTTVVVPAVRGSSGLNS